MSNNISFRDVKFSAQEFSTTVIVKTDVPCHLWCRLSTTEPQIHPKAILRRGLQIMTEFRYCFVAYNDFEQLEIGDTLTHSWLFTDWTYCITKWCYFWGTIDIYVSPSTSPTFKFHNNLRLYPPVMTLKILEPWTYYGPPTPPFVLKTLETWGITPPPYTRKTLEPWSS